MDKRDSMRFEFTLSFRPITYIATMPSAVLLRTSQTRQYIKYVSLNKKISVKWIFIDIIGDASILIGYEYRDYAERSKVRAYYSDVTWAHGVYKRRDSTACSTVFFRLITKCNHDFRYDRSNKVASTFKCLLWWQNFYFYIHAFCNCHILRSSIKWVTP